MAEKLPVIVGNWRYNKIQHVLQKLSPRFYKIGVTTCHFKIMPASGAARSPEKLREAVKVSLVEVIGE